MLELHITPVAVKDLNKIKQFIADDSEIVAEKTVQEILKQFELLTLFPNMGSLLEKRVTFRTNYRYLVVENYIVLYKVTKNYVEIYRVINRYQDITKILE